MALGRHLEGCRIGFDLGATDRKAAAVIDGEPVFTEEVVWDPRNAVDPSYHYNEIMAGLKSAAEAPAPRGRHRGQFRRNLHQQPAARRVALSRRAQRPLRDSRRKPLSGHEELPGAISPSKWSTTAR